MGSHREMLLLVLIFVLLMLGGCGGSTPAQEVQPGANKVQSPVANPGFELPPPSGLIGAATRERQAAYLEADLVKVASDYEPGFPQNNIGPAGQQAIFNPSWTDSTNSDELDLAYGIYNFVIDGYDRNPQVRYDWDAPLANPAEGWIGLGDWANDRWDWYAGEAGGKLDLASLTPYFNGTNELLLVVLRIGTAQSTLNEVRIGGTPPVAGLSADPTAGMVPLHVGFNGSSSTDADGSIVKYEWDWDGDGTYDMDTGDDPVPGHDYATAGVFDMVMRVTDDDGLSDTERAEVTAAEPWVHTWGGSGTEVISAMIQVGSSLYCTGYSSTYVGTGSNALLLMRYSLQGELQWARAFYGDTSDLGIDLTLASDGDIIVVGRTDSWGGGGTDFLIQKWNPNGTLDWSRVWGGADFDVALGVATGGTNIYITGSSSSYGEGGEDIMLVKIDKNGTVMWGTAWGGAGVDKSYDIQHIPTLGTDHNFRAVGKTSSFGEGLYDVVCLDVSEAGVITSQRTWGNSASQEGSALRMGFAGGYTYICGSDSTSGTDDLLLLEYTTGSDFTRKVWDRAGLQQANDLLYWGGVFYLAGVYTEDGGSVFKGLYLTIDDTSWAISARVFHSPPTGSSFLCLQPFAGYEGIYLGGKATDASGVFANSYGASATDIPLVTWQTQNGIVTPVPVGALPTNNSTIEDITAGVIDSGGGDYDAGLVLVDVN